MKFAMYITIEEFSNQLGVGRNKAYSILKDPECEAVKLGNTWLIPPLAAENYVRKKVAEKRMKAMTA